MKASRLLACSLFAFFIFAAVTTETHSAVVLEGSGIARILKNDIKTAREIAIKSALFDASSKYQSNIFGYTATNRGIITGDNTLLYSNARIVRYDVVQEKIIDANQFSVTLKVTLAKNFKKIRCKKKSKKERIVINYPTINFRNINADEEFLLRRQLDDSFKNFETKLGKNSYPQFSRIDFVSSSMDKPGRGGSYESYLYGGPKQQGSADHQIFMHLEFDRIDKTLFGVYRLNYRVQFKGSGSNFDRTGSLEFVNTVDTPFTTINAFSNSELRVRELEIPFSKIIDLGQISIKQKSYCEPLAAKLQVSSLGQFINLGSANGITRNDLGWIKEGAQDQILLVDRIEKNKTFFRKDNDVEINLNTAPLVTMVRYE